MLLSLVLLCKALVHPAFAQEGMGPKFLAGEPAGAWIGRPQWRKAASETGSTSVMTKSSRVPILRLPVFLATKVSK